MIKLAGQTPEYLEIERYQNEMWVKQLEESEATDYCPTLKCPYSSNSEDRIFNMDERGYPICSKNKLCEALMEVNEKADAQKRGLEF